MSKIVRHEFMGNWLLLWLLCIGGVTLPIAVLYLLFVRSVWKQSWMTQRDLCRHFEQVS
jgi:hypothetical protein